MKVWLLLEAKLNKQKPARTGFRLISGNNNGIAVLLIEDVWQKIEKA
jgi:hypothetical protein